MKNKFLQMLGITAKAGRMVSGEFYVEQALKKREPYLVIVAEDASDNTKKHFRDMCTYRDIPILFTCSKEELGKSIGKGNRTSIGILDKGLAEGLISAIREV